MDRSQARETAKGMIGEYLRRKGINPRKEFLCLNPAHPDNHPSMGLIKGGVNVHCLSCGATYDIFDLVALDYGLSEQKAIFDKTYEILGLTVENTGRRSTPAEDFSEMNGQKQDKTGQPTHTDVYTHTHKAEELDFTPEIEAAHAALMNNPQALAHFTERGLSPEFIQSYRIGYAERGYNSLLAAYPEYQSKSKKAGLYKYVLPFPDETGKVSYFQTEIIDRSQVDDYNGKYRKMNGLPAPLFNERYLRGKTPEIIFLTEGLYDAYSIEIVGGKAIALQGAGGDTRFIKCYKQYSPETTIVFYMDADGAGAGYEERIIKALPQLSGRYIVRHPSAGKDANEELVKSPEAFSQAVAQMIADAQSLTLEAENEKKQAEEEAREAYLSTSAGAHLQDFINGISESANTEAIPTGFEKLDSVLDGGLYEGLITVGGISSLGKTSLIMQVADQVAAAGTDVLIFSLEMSRSQLMSKSISRLTDQIAEAEGIDTRNAKTARGITAGSRYQNYNRTELDLITRAIEAYQKYAGRIYIQEGIGDIGIAQIKETVERHILSTGGGWTVDEKTGDRKLSGGRRPLVVVDYLQILAPYNDRATDKQNTDKAVLELKRISRDYKLPVIAISSFNRDNYKAAVGFEAFKESGAIEYSSDILLGLQLQGAGDKNFDATEKKKKNPRDIELVVLKNRDAAVGDKVSFAYYPMFNLFKET